GADARVGQVAAVLREFTVGGVHFTETWDDSSVPPMGCGIVLAPWVNRIAGATWEHQGKPQKLDITEIATGNAIHGLLRNTAYTMVAQQADSVTLEASIYPQHGYPFTLDTDVTYALIEDGLKVTHRLTNVGSEAAPFGVGAHPYLRVGDHPVDDLTITLTASRYSRNDDKQIPVVTESVDGTVNDLRGGVRLADLDVDVPLTGFTVIDGRIEHRLDAPDGTGLVIWADEVFDHAQVYSPSNFPGPGKPDQRRAVAIEPVSCAVNAFNTGEGLRWLAPGETWFASWGLRPVGF
ncbi:MAG: aldose 1-epimerase family protein, partial [Nakamurella sp.]